MSSYRLTSLARADLVSTGDYIARDSPQRAITFIDEILDACQRIARQPRLYARQEDLAPGLGNRS